MEAHFKGNPSFKNVHVKGEVSSTYTSPKGHFYFTLKDEKSQIPCIVYQWFRKNIKFDIENGMELLVIANVTVYPPHGKYQLDVRSAMEDGLGQLFVKYQQIKKKLSNEGLFDDKHKKELPRFVKRIGVITSEGGAVIHDIIKTVRQNWPYCQVFLFPASVQGANSKRELILQITKADNFEMDVLIVGRGGGSIEDLWSFNEEEVVRTIFKCNTPVISAVGHDSDVTLTDLVADKSASTPTMAASLAIEDKNNILENITHYNVRLITFISSKLDDYKKQMDFMLSKPIFVDKTYVYKVQKDNFDDLHIRFDIVSRELVKSNRVLLNNVTAEYVIRHPCKIQLDSSRSNLNELESRLIEVMDKTSNENRVNLDRAVNKFKFLSQKMIISKRHDLEMSRSYLMTNPCQKQIDSSKNNLNLIEDKLITQTKANLENNKRNFELVSNNLKNNSNELILRNSHRLDSIKNSSVIKNPQRLYELKYNELIQVKHKKVIRNPYSILDTYKNELDIYREKLDKINQVMELKKEQQKQKQKYLIAIVAIVIFMILILLLIMFGGIL